jgi:hypothetical protein
MKLQRVNQVEPELFREGDKVTATVTHNIKINGDDSWVKYEITSTQGPEETIDDVDTRVIQHATRTVVNLAYSAAQRVLEAAKGEQDAVRD